MKLVIQIPCYNEESMLPVTLAALPRSLPGVDTVEWLVVDDGSTDQTVQVARDGGVDYVVRHPRNFGLAQAFNTGLRASVEQGADIVVNLDADNQYCADDIGKLVQPILAGEADLVVGARPIGEMLHFSLVKRLLQKLGSWVVRFVSGTEVADAPSGFRAMTRQTAMRLHVFSGYTYTLETVIQAGQKGMRVVSVPIRVTGPTRPSRLIRSIPLYVMRSAVTILRIFVIYKPFVFFMWLGSIPLAAGVLIGLRFLYYFTSGDGSGHIQSLLLATILIVLGFLLYVLALIGDLLSVNRRLLEGIDWPVRRLEQERDA